MDAKRSLPRFTPVFHWVLRATGDTSVAVAYGIVWQYAQMRDADCHASCTRLAAELGWSRQRVMRHLRALRRLGLIVCTNPFAHGVTRHYVPVSEEEWLSPRDYQVHTPCAGSLSLTADSGGPYRQVDREATGDPADLWPPATPAPCKDCVPVPGSDRGSHETYPAPVAPLDGGGDGSLRAAVPDCDTRETYLKRGSRIKEEKREGDFPRPRGSCRARRRHGRPR